MLRLGPKSRLVTVPGHKIQLMCCVANRDAIIPQTVLALRGSNGVAIEWGYELFLAPSKPAAYAQPQ